MKIKFLSAAKLRFAAIALFSLICVSRTEAQKFAADYLRGGIHDGNLLLGEYLKPFGNGFGAGMNNGWYNTAETHKKLGFSVSLITNMTFIPGEDKTYDLSSLNLQKLSLTDPSNVTAPSVFGDKKDGPGLEIRVDDPSIPGADRSLVLTRFNAPKGLGIGFMPTAMIQGAIGLPKGTEIMVRYLPTISASVGKMSLWGGGFKHDIKQWIPGVSAMPFDVSVMAGFTRVLSGVDLELQPDANSVGAVGTYSNQDMLFNVNALTGNLIVSKKIAFFTPHVSVGFNNSRSRLRIQGDYPIVTGVVTDSNSPDYTKKVYEKVTDPVDVKFDNITDFRVNAGFRLKMLGIIALSLDYTLAKYSTVSLGIGVSVR